MNGRKRLRWMGIPFIPYRLFSAVGIAQAGMVVPPLVSLLLSCSPKAPVAIRPGEVACHYCHMGIVDLRFNAQALTRKGRILQFDSIECLIGYENEHPGEVERAWVSDAMSPGKWIPFEKAWILRSEKLPSPMGAFLSAYSGEKEFQKARAQYGGRRLSPEELESYIRKRWKPGSGLKGAISAGALLQSTLPPLETVGGFEMGS